MKVFVTGGAGFIGSHLVPALLKAGHRVTVYDNLCNGKAENLPPEPMSFLFFQEDIRDIENLRKRMKGAEVVYHLAALPRITPSLENPVEAHDVNLTGTLNVLQVARENRAHVVFAGSSSIFGKGAVVPMRENDPKNPNSPYAMQKLMAESYIQMYRSLWNLKATVLRFFNVFGERQPETGAYAVVAGIFMGQKQRGEQLTIKGDGSQRRDFTYVGDVVKALLAVGERGIEGTYHIGTGKNVSVQELADAIDPGGQRKQIEMSVGDYPVTLADITKARDTFDYEPNVNILDWLKQC